MGYWEQVKEMLAKSADMIIEQTKKGAKFVAEKAGEGLQYTKIKTSLYRKHKELNGVMADLGDLVYDLIQEDKEIKTHEMVQEYIGRASKIEEECKELEQQLAELKEDDDEEEEKKES